MGKFGKFGITLAEGQERPPKETENIRIYILAVVAGCAGLCFGYDLGFIGSTIAQPAFEAFFHTKSHSASWNTNFSANVVSVQQAGAIAGALLSVPIADRLGRRLTLLFAGLVFVIGSALQTWPNNIAMLFAGRVINGLSVGCTSFLAPLYIAECAPPHIRGRLVGMYEVFVQTGTCIGFWVNYGTNLHFSKTDNAQWRISMAIQLIPGGLLAIGMAFMRETPRFVAKSNPDKALKILAYLRRLPEDHLYVQTEVYQILTQLEHERHLASGRFAVIRESLGRSNIRRLITGVFIMIFFQMSGTNSLNYYSPRIMTSLGLSSTQASLFATGVYGLVRWVAILIAMLWASDKFGRRTMFIFGGVGMGAMMWIVGGIVQATNPTTTGAIPLTASAYVAIVCIYLYAVFFCFSFAGVPWTYCSEIFPLRIRGFCVAITTATHWTFNFVIARTTPFILNSTGAGIFFLFGACLTLSVPFTYFFVPETKGVRLEDMDELWSRKPWHRKVARRPSVEEGQLSPMTPSEAPDTKDEIHQIEHL